MMDAKQEILARIRRATPDITEPEPATDVPIHWEYGRDLPMEDVVGEFVAKVRDYDATVVRCPRTEIPDAIAAGLRALGTTERVVVPGGLDPAWKDAIGTGFTVVEDDPPLSNHDLDAVGAVVTAAASGIADTGTIVLDHAHDQGRRALSLVPDRHVCVIRASQILSDVPESLQAVKEAFRTGLPLTLISGGSATSDIELSRVNGVHGPRRLYVIVVDDA